MKKTAIRLAAANWIHLLTETRALLPLQPSPWHVWTQERYSRWSPGCRALVQEVSIKRSEQERLVTTASIPYQQIESIVIIKFKKNHCYNLLPKCSVILNKNWWSRTNSKDGLHASWWYDQIPKRRDHKKLLHEVVLPHKNGIGL